VKLNIEKNSDNYEPSIAGASAHAGAADIVVQKG